MSNTHTGISVIRLITLLVTSSLLAACNSHGEGTNFSLDATTESGGKVKAGVDGTTGGVTIDAPGLKAAIALPKIQLDADDVDISGVKLYPGSKVTGMNVTANDRTHSGGQVRIAFDAPADAATVKDWFGKEMTKKAFKFSASAAGLSGTTEDGDAFSLDLKPGAAGHTSGTLNVDDQK